MREDILKTSYACYFAELVNTLTAEKDKNEEIFDLLLRSLTLLKGSASPKRISRILEIKLLMISGLMPRLDRCVLCEKQIDFKGASFDKTRFSYKSGGLICKDCSIR